MPAMEMVLRVDPRSLIETVSVSARVEFDVQGKSYTIKKLVVIKRGG
jgi:hypothetical protein